MAHLINEVYRSSDPVKALKYAIKNKFLVYFYYEGWKVDAEDENGEKKFDEYTKKGPRWVQPAALGYSPKEKPAFPGDEPPTPPRLMLRGYQIMGTTNTAKKAWKTFLVDEIRGDVLVYNNSEISGDWFQPFQEPGEPDVAGVPKYVEGGDKKFAGAPTDFVKVGDKPGFDRKAYTLRSRSKKTDTVVPVEPTGAEPVVDPATAQTSPEPTQPKGYTKRKAKPKADPVKVEPVQADEPDKIDNNIIKGDKDMKTKDDSNSTQKNARKNNNIQPNPEEETPEEDQPQ